MHDKIVPKRGEIYLCDMGESESSKQGGVRPVIILQNNKGNECSPMTIVCPLTSQNKKQLPTHMILNPKKNGVEKKSIALFEQISVVSKDKLMNKIGELDRKEIETVNKKIMISLGVI